ncbi:MAG: DUF6089 family protein [Chitinophagaceae bacterium]
MTLKLLAFSSLIFVFAAAHSQTFWEKSHLGIGVGAMQYNGDLRNTYTKFAIQGNYTYELTDHFNLRGQVFFGSVGASDGDTPPFENEWTDEANGIRNPEARPHPFNSQIQEASILGEYNLYNMNDGKKWTPYVFAGLGYFHYNPYYTWYSTSDNRYYNYRWATEGSHQRINIPFGGGIRYGLTDDIRLNLEGNFRYTTTDEIDAYPPPTRDWSKTKDYFFSVTFGISFRLGGDYHKKSDGKSSKFNDRKCPPVYQ